MPSQSSVLPSRAEQPEPPPVLEPISPSPSADFPAGKDEDAADKPADEAADEAGDEAGEEPEELPLANLLYKREVVGRLHLALEDYSEKNELMEKRIGHLQNEVAVLKGLLLSQAVYPIEHEVEHKEESTEEAGERSFENFVTETCRELHSLSSAADLEDALTRAKTLSKGFGAQNNVKLAVLFANLWQSAVRELEDAKIQQDVIDKALQMYISRDADALIVSAECILTSQSSAYEQIPLRTWCSAVVASARRDRRKLMERVQSLAKALELAVQRANKGPDEETALSLLSSHAEELSRHCTIYEEALTVDRSKLEAEARRLEDGLASEKEKVANLTAELQSKEIELQAFREKLANPVDEQPSSTEVLGKLRQQLQELIKKHETAVDSAPAQWQQQRQMLADEIDALNEAVLKLTERSVEAETRAERLSLQTIEATAALRKLQHKQAAATKDEPTITKEEGSAAAGPPAVSFDGVVADLQKKLREAQLDKARLLKEHAAAVHSLAKTAATERSETAAPEEHPRVKQLVDMLKGVLQQLSEETNFKLESIFTTSVDSSGPQSEERIAEALRKRLQCPLCNERWRDRTLVNCGHTFCKDCLEKCLAARNRKCPGCHQRCQLSDIVPIFFT